MIQSLSAVTLATHDMGRAVGFYRALGFSLRYGGEQGLAPDSAPADAAWGERYFHITDPDGHEISLASPVSV
jgi:hypothetical protein